MTTQTSIADDAFVAFRVRFELERQNCSQAHLARALGVPRDYLHRRVHGDVPFSAVEIANVAEVLGVDVSVFFPRRPKGCDDE